MANPFDYFDKIVCICTRKETKRWKSVSKVFDKLGIKDRIDVFDDEVDSGFLKKEYGQLAE